MIDTKDILPIGSLVRTHGKSGELQCRAINSYWDESDADFAILMLDGIPVPFRVIDWRCKGSDILFTFRGIDTEDAALRLVGAEVCMLRRDVVAENNTGILSWQDIVGYTINGCPIREVDDSTANVLAVMQDGRLLPLHEDLITAIDHVERTITMNLPEGL